MFALTARAFSLSHRVTALVEEETGALKKYVDLNQGGKKRSLHASSAHQSMI